MTSSMRMWFLCGCAAVAGLSAPRAVECVGNGIGGPYRGGVQTRRAAAQQVVAAAPRANASPTEPRAAHARDRR